MPTAAAAAPAPACCCRGLRNAAATVASQQDLAQCTGGEVDVDEVLHACLTFQGNAQLPPAGGRDTPNIPKHGLCTKPPQCNWKQRALR
eukprot:scaffold19812_cov16-Tisochrysis_lutea.AAC.1